MEYSYDGVFYYGKSSMEVIMGEIAQKYNEQVDKIIRNKIYFAISRLGDDDIKLRESLYSLYTSKDLSDIETILNELRECGYELKLDIPEPEFKKAENHPHYTMSAVLDYSKSKLIITKNILEV